MFIEPTQALENNCAKTKHPANVLDAQSNETQLAKWECRRIDVGIEKNRPKMDGIFIGTAC